MIEIKLTQGKIAFVDDEDFEKLNQFKWHTNPSGRNNWRATRGVRENKKQKQISMHREILNAPAGMQVDHINGNSLDNRKINLRLCTNQQNGFNKKYPNKRNKLGIKGVCCRHKHFKKFKANIFFNGRNIHLGYFNVMGDADSAYRIAEEKYFGKFARGNI